MVRAGVYSNSYDASLNVKNGFPVFSTVIEANSIGKQEDQFAAFRLTDEDRQEIHRLARDPRIGELLPPSPIQAETDPSTLLSISPIVLLKFHYALLSKCSFVKEKFRDGLM